jgi:hypothetical protein
MIGSAFTRLLCRRFPAGHHGEAEPLEKRVAAAQAGLGEAGQATVGAKRFVETRLRKTAAECV